MLVIEIINTNKGTNEKAIYEYGVRINEEIIVTGEIGDHNRNDGWAELVRAISERHLTKPLATVFTAEQTAHIRRIARDACKD